MSTPYSPQPGSVEAQLWMAELAEDERVDLPAVYHRPYFDSLSDPPTWVCEACYGDGWATAWPCPAADTRSGGVELADSLGLRCSR